jgi:hypothetical protein
MGLSVVSIGALCLAWAKNADYFAMTFAAMAAMASIEAFPHSR